MTTKKNEVTSMNKIKAIFITGYAMLLTAGALAQDLHFSQFYNSPLTTNPANTGFIPDGDYRLGINYRNQWASVMNMPYKTMSAFADAQLMRDRFETGWIGIGGVILRDVAGSGNLTSTKIYGSLAYHQELGYSSLISLGFNVGYANKQINTTNLKFPDQFDGFFFDSKLPTGAQLSRNSIGYADVQVGLNYAYFPTEKMYVNTGFSVHHVNKPKESFFEANDANFDNKVAPRYIGFLNGSFKVSDRVIVNPNIYYSVQTKASELTAGLNAHYDLSGDGSYQLIGGLYYRAGEAIIPMFGLGYNEYELTFSYDATVSSLKAYNQTRGALELSLIKSGVFDQFKGNRRQSLCPTFRN